MMDEQWQRGPGAHRDAATVELFDEPAAQEQQQQEQEQAPEPVEDDLSAQLAAAAPRRWWSRSTVYLAAAALLVAGFLGGVQVQKSYGAAATTGNGANSPAGGYFPRQNGGGGQQGGTGQQAGAGRGTTGTIKLVDGGTVYVQTASGDVITIKTTGDTKVAVARAGALKDLKAGDAVTVQGATGADGTVTATTVTATPK
jgi:hypothetical protein